MNAFPLSAFSTVLKVSEGHSLAHASAEPDSDRAGRCPGLRSSALVLSCRCDKTLSSEAASGRKGFMWLMLPG